MSVKKAKYIKEPDLKKQPKSSEPIIHEGKVMAWRFSASDKNGPYCWSNFESTNKFKEIIEKLHEFETMTLEALKSGGSHPVEVYKLDKTAKDRLVTIKRDDVDELMSFRLNGRNRVWCVREENIMRILWWDPMHIVCPSLKKHT